MTDKEKLENFLAKVEWEGDIMYVLQNWGADNMPDRLKRSARQAINGYTIFLDDLYAMKEDEGIDDM